MITNDKLDIFERFEIDRKLPKYKSKKKATEPAIRSKFMASSDDADEGEDVGGFEMRFSGSSIQLSERLVSEPRPWYYQFITFLKGTIPTLPEPPHTLSVEEFFTHVKNSTEEIQLVQTRLEGYTKALEDARRNGHKWLFANA